MVVTFDWMSDIVDDKLLTEELKVSTLPLRVDSELPRPDTEVWSAPTLVLMVLTEDWMLFTVVCKVATEELKVVMLELMDVSELVIELSVVWMFVRAVCRLVIMAPTALI